MSARRSRPQLQIVTSWDRGSFTAAAKELNLTRPPVTHEVQELGRRFKVALVERCGKRAYLTEAGDKLIEHAQDLLEED
jgi:DNA-binding transcriptional LysR family regulator